MSLKNYWTATLLGVAALGAAFEMSAAQETRPQNGEDSTRFSVLRRSGGVKRALRAFVAPFFPFVGDFRSLFDFRFEQVERREVVAVGLKRFGGFAFRVGGSC